MEQHPSIVKAKKIRGKHKKIAYLKRAAAARAHHHRKRHKRLARLYFLVLTLLAVVLLYMGMIVAARAADLIPPPGRPIDAGIYKRAVLEAQAAAAAAKTAYHPPDQAGVGSWYALGLRSPDALTCASTKFPRGTYLEVTDLRNGNTVVCLVNDYGPAASTHRVIDLSRGSYRQLEGLGSGTMPVEIRVTQAPQ